MVPPPLRAALVLFLVAPAWPWPLNYPVENQFAGLEVAPGDTEWGHDVTVNFQTSNRDFADSDAKVDITFFGDRAVSHVMHLQTRFLAGKRDTKVITLDHEIGSLQKIRLETNSSDGWLLEDISCDIGPSTYFFEHTTTFLDRPNPYLAVTLPAGQLEELYEPQAPRLSTPDGVNGEGLLGVESIELKVVREVHTFRDPDDTFEDIRVDVAP